eukprot:1187332-Pyramimonas_sp.AAC.2
MIAKQLGFGGSIGIRDRSGQVEFEYGVENIWVWPGLKAMRVFPWQRAVGGRLGRLGRRRDGAFQQCEEGVAEARMAEAGEVQQV